MNADFGSFSFSEEGSDPGQRRALTRALASESRNALARVELAASELARHELTPGVAGRVATIRAAAEEIDTLLAKIDLLSNAERLPDRETADFGWIARSVLARLTPSLEARGLVLNWADARERRSNLTVVGTRAALEALCLGFIRWIAGSGAFGEFVGVELVERDGFACLIARSEAGRRNTGFDGTTRLELEVALAECNGRLLLSEGAEGVEAAIGIPLRGSAGEHG